MEIELVILCTMPVILQGPENVLLNQNDYCARE